MKLIEQSLGSKVLICALVITTLGVTPLYSYDPINVFRFSAVTVFGAISLFLLIINRQQIFFGSRFQVLIISVSFLIWVTLISIRSKMGITDIIFGVSGRNTGLITYVAFLSLMLLAVIKASKKLILNIILILLICGFISAIYGLVQSFGLDPFNWINPYSPVFGFFGNPNFQASYMGISATAAFSYLLQKNRLNLLRILLGIYIPLALYVVYKSKSQQGYLVFITGISVVIYFWIKSHNRLSKFTPLYVLFWIIGVFLVLIDILQRSPWGPIFYKPSITFRGDFWRAGWSITTDNFIFGVGLDGYRDSYRLYRDRVAAERNPTSMVDSAHNVFLDISSGGGFPLLVIYCALILLVIISIIKVSRREKEFNYGFAAVSGAWVAYLAQSAISINQIGLAIWGWVLSGVIIGFEINSRTESQIITAGKRAAERVGIVFGLIIGLAISLPLLVTDGQFRSTIKTGDVIKIEKNLDQWPQSVIRMNLAAQLFIDGGFADRALIISQKAVKLNPRNFEAWEIIYLNPQTDENSKSQALLKMRELDPLNPNIK
jgi:O-antigen ligase